MAHGEKERVRLSPTFENRLKVAQYLAALETARVNQFIPFSLQKMRSGSNNTTSQKVTFDMFDAGFVYVVTSISASDADDAAHQIKVGVTDAGSDFVYEAATVANAGDTVSYVGQLMLKETDQVYAEFRSVGTGDVLKVFVNGYKIRK